MTPLEAIACIKAEVPEDDLAPALELGEEDSPILKRIGGGLLVAYLVDEGDSFTYVQGRHLRVAGIDKDQLHARAVENLRNLAEGQVTIRQNGPTHALFFDGNFEASLILLDEMWDEDLVQYHGSEPVVAIPARDVLCFCNASSVDGMTNCERSSAAVGRMEIIWCRRSCSEGRTERGYLFMISFKRRQTTAHQTR